MVQNSHDRHVSTGPLARLFARSLAPLTRSLAPDCSLCSRPPLRPLRSLARSLRSLPRSWESEFFCLKMTWFCPIVGSSFGVVAGSALGFLGADNSKPSKQRGHMTQLAPKREGGQKGIFFTGAFYDISGKNARPQGTDMGKWWKECQWIDGAPGSILTRMFGHEMIKDQGEDGSPIATCRTSVRQLLYFLLYSTHPYVWS